MKLKSYGVKYKLIAATREEKQAFKKFLAEAEKAFEKLGPLYLPKVRGFNRTVLVPDVEQDPCQICADAAYNRTCVHTRTCAPMLFHNLSRLNAITRKGDQCSAHAAKPSGRTRKRKRA